MYKNEFLKFENEYLLKNWKLSWGQLGKIWKPNWKKKTSYASQWEISVKCES